MIHHVALETAPDVADSLVAFFGLLGFEEVKVPASLAGRTRWLGSGATQVHLLLSDSPVAPPAGHVAVVVPDYEEALARLRAAGHEVDERAEHWGSPRCFARAPGGHRVEVMRFPPPAA